MKRLAALALTTLLYSPQIDAEESVSPWLLEISPRLTNVGWAFYMLPACGHWAASGITTLPITIEHYVSMLREQDRGYARQMFDRGRTNAQNEFSYNKTLACGSISPQIEAYANGLMPPQFINGIWDAPGEHKSPIAYSFAASDWINKKVPIIIGIAKFSRIAVKCGSWTDANHDRIMLKLGDAEAELQPADHDLAIRANIVGEAEAQRDFERVGLNACFALSPDLMNELEALERGRRRFWKKP